MDQVIEEESGTYTPRRVHRHNGYCAGDFSSIPFKQPELRALLADAIIEAAAHSNLDDEPQWIPDPEPAPQEYELCGVGVIAEIAQFRPSGSRHVVLQGVARGIVTELVQQEPYLVARVTRVSVREEMGREAVRLLPDVVQGAQLAQLVLAE